MTELDQLRIDVDRLRQDLKDAQENSKAITFKATQEVALQKVYTEQWELRALRSEKNEAAWEKLFRCADERLENLDPEWVKRTDCPDCVKAQQALGVTRKQPDGSLKFV